VVAVLATHRAIALAAITGALLLLRARSQIDRSRRSMFVISGIFTSCATLTATAVGLPQHGPWIVTLTAIVAALAMYLGFVAPTRSPSPIARRAFEALECLALVAMVPVACWICGAFSAVRGMDLL
jgi:membrane-anchored mycosin MYCP